MIVDLKDFFSNLIDKDDFNNGLIQIITMNILFVILISLDKDILSKINIEYFMIDDNGLFKGIVFKCDNFDILGEFNMNIFRKPYTRNIKYSYKKLKNNNLQLEILEVNREENNDE